MRPARRATVAEDSRVAVDANIARAASMAPAAAARRTSAALAAIRRRARPSRNRPCSSTASPTRTARSSPTFRSTDISEYVTRPDCFVWVALFEPDAEELDEMAEEFGLHPLAVEDARKGHQRPKIEEYDDSLFAVLHTVEPPSDGRRGASSSARSTIFVGPNYILSVRHRTKGLRRRPRAHASASRSCCGTDRAYVFYALMDTVVDRYFPILDALEIGARGDRGADLRRAIRRARTSRRSTR